MKKIEFTTKPYGQDGFFGVKHETLKDEEIALFEINSHLWTPQKVQELIDESLALNDDEDLEFKMNGSNLFMIIDNNEVYFYNSMVNKKEEDFIWTFDKFINFLKDFKKFIEENS